MLTAAGEGETATYAIAAAHRYCLTSGGRGRCGGDVDIRVHLACDVLLEKGRDVAAVASDHRAPAGGAFGHSQRLDDSNLSQRVEFGRTPGMWQHHAKDAGVFHRLCETRWNAPHLLHLVAGGANLRG